jgi:U3 small nucleolar RNA-associated protein 25
VKLSPLQSDLMKPVGLYKDVLYGDKTIQQSKEIGDLLALHTLNHIYKTRDKVVRNSDCIKKATLLNEPIPYV